MNWPAFWSGFWRGAAEGAAITLILGAFAACGYALGFAA